MTYLFYLIISLIVTRAWSFTSLPKKSDALNCPSISDPYVYLTVNNILLYYYNDPKEDVYWRSFQFSWKPPVEVKPFDWIGLFHNDEVGININKPIFRFNITHSEPGFHQTMKNLPEDVFPKGRVIIEGCALNYWTAYIQDGKPIMVNCVMLRPHWMENEKDVIGDVPLNKLMIPGTQNSAFINPLESKKRINRKNYYQAESIWNQLNYGIRYLDIKVGYFKNTTEKFWVSNNCKRVSPFLPHILDISDFVKKTKEVIIIEFSGFHGFDNNLLKEFQLILKKRLNHIMIKEMDLSTLTYNKMQQLKKNVLVTFRESHPKRLHWNAMLRLAKETSSVDDLINTIKPYKDSDYNFYTAILALTPPPSSNNVTDLSLLSAKLAKKIPSLILDPFWQYFSNIIATNFFLGNNLIEESILANRRRYSCEYCLMI